MLAHLRDRWGITQITINRETLPDVHTVASTARNEWVLQISGTVTARPAGAVSPGAGAAAARGGGGRGRVVVAARGAGQGEDQGERCGVDAAAAHAGPLPAPFAHL